MIVDQPKVAPIDSAAPVQGTRRVALWVCALALAIAWMPRLFWGLWTDEAGTYWMGAAGWREAIARSWDLPGQSVLYGAISSFFTFGQGWLLEPVLRLPSMLAMAFAAWQLKRIAERKIGAGAGWIAAALFACSPDIFEFGTSARVYGFALAAAVASFRYLLDWQDGKRGATLAKYLVASVLVVQFHYLFAMVFVAQAIYVALRWRRLGLALLLSAAVVLPLSLLPLLGQLRQTAQQASGFANGAPPEALDLAKAIFQPMLLLPAVLGAVLLLVTGRKLRWSPLKLDRGIVVLGALTLLLGPLVYFAVGRATGHSIFNTRYMLFSVPPMILALTWAIAALPKAEWRAVVLVAVLGGTALHPGRLLLAWRGSPTSWREPIEAARGKQGTLLITSGMVESGTYDWQSHDPHASILYSALTVYPLANRTLPLPYQLDEAAQEFVRAEVASRGDGRYMLLASAGSPLMEWMSGHMKDAGYEVREHAVNDYSLVEFQRVAVADVKE